MKATRKAMHGIGYGAILLLAPAVMAWGLYSNIKKHRKLQTLDQSKK